MKWKKINTTNYANYFFKIFRVVCSDSIGLIYNPQGSLTANSPDVNKENSLGDVWQSGFLCRSELSDIQSPYKKGQARC